MLSPRQPLAEGRLGSFIVDKLLRSHLFRKLLNGKGCPFRVIVAWFETASGLGKFLHFPFWPPAMAAPLVLLAVLTLACAQTPVFRIGGTQTSCGNGADQSAAMRSALLFYANYTNNNGGVMINGTRHDLDIIMYASTLASSDDLTLTSSRPQL